ncbi:MAG: DUF4159 domain-containing protein [Pseudomonadota bacterium]
MSGLGALAFLTPWWLGALAGLPILYWLLRVTPPAPRRTRFPAIRLLLALKPKEETPAQTPLWLLALRLVLATWIILALAHPVLNPAARLDGPGPLVVVVDDGWGAARNWSERKTAIADLIERAERAERTVLLLTTAPSIAGEAPRASRLMPARDARTQGAAIEPKPWPVDRAAAAASLGGLDFAGPANVVYLADGLEDGEVAAFLERLQRLGPVEMVMDPPDRLARLLLAPVAEAGGMSLAAARADGGAPALGFLRASADDGRLLAREELRWMDGQTSASARIVLPTELRNRLSRLEIEGEASAGAVVLLDERWRRRPVGLVSGGPLERQQPLLADIYYLERALAPFSEVRVGAIADLLRRELAVLVLADVGRLPEAERATLDAWMGKGGVVVRFAGPRMAEGGDDLVPVPLRAGGTRAFGGAMSWSQPVGLAAFEAAGAFAGLAIPDDVKVSRQVLAEPNLDLGAKTWARLADGTPLVTADRRGEGWLVLVHTTATPEWSSLPIAGLFIDMLRRLVALSQGVAGDVSDAVLPPMSSLDGFGRLQAPSPAALAISGRAFASVKIGPKYPPGLYGNDSGRRALNLSASVEPPRAIASLPAGVARRAFLAEREMDLKPWLLVAALGLALVDLWISLALRGLMPRLTRRGVALVLLLALAPAAAAAQTPRSAAPSGRVEDATALAATLSIRFAYVRTGQGEVDEVSRAGLAGLGLALSRRTAVDPGPPVDIDIERDEIVFFPLVYWPIIPEAPRPSAEATARLNAFLRHGGTIVFDTRDAGSVPPGTLGAAGQRLRDILRGLNLPALVTVPPDHVLTKAFYLLSEFPGRWTGGPVWVEQGDGRVNDGVSSIVIGAHDWAAAWATDAQGRPLFAVVPGGEAQREPAIRFGINLVMYALTGNYKADQVHIEAILERLKR